jgi:hypothetical protein
MHVYAEEVVEWAKILHGDGIAEVLGDALEKCNTPCI